MIRKYRFGKPIPTDAVVKELDVQDTLPELFEADDKHIRIELDKDDIVYGLGQAVRGLDKRGYVYNSICSDEFMHTEDKTSLYGAHNFLLINSLDRTKSFAIFIDTPSELSFDVAFTNTSEINIDIKHSSYDLYVIKADSLPAIVAEFRELIGRSYIPPKWAFGYGQSRWSYNNADEVREVVRGHRDNGIPLDMVYLDIDYMDSFKDFTIDEEAFPDFEEFVNEMKSEHIHLIPIIDAGVKIEAGYDVYEEGVKEGYFCKKADGSNIICGVWPGEVHFPDFLNADARKWFGKKYDFLIDKGIDGFWNDMNEPAIFYTKDSLDTALDKMKTYKSEDINIHNFFTLKDMIANLSNNREDYKLFYHDYKGERYSHELVHNLYGYNMTRAAGEHFDSLDKDILMFSRASYIGAHRYGGIWQGDNHSWWSHIKLNMSMTMSLGMVGFLFTGADIGGFSSNTSPQLMLRWLEFGIFTPLMRNHSAIFTRQQEAFRFDNMSQMRDIIRIRYAMLDYIYEQFKSAVEANSLYMRPLSFDYPDDMIARKIEDEILVGDSIMIAPVYEQNATSRYVYLPEKMKMMRLSSPENIYEEVLEKGHHYIEVAMNEVLIFVKEGKDFVLGEANEYVD